MRTHKDNERELTQGEEHRDEWQAEALCWVAALRNGQAAGGGARS